MKNLMFSKISMSIAALALLAVFGLAGCGGGGGNNGDSETTIRPADIGMSAPKASPENVTVLPTGEEISSEMISISFKEGVSKQNIDSIIISVGGTIAGEIPEIGYYIKFTPPKTATEIKDIIYQLSKAKPKCRNRQPGVHLRSSRNIPIKCRYRI